jgi:type I restriction enzyme M protein
LPRYIDSTQADDIRDIDAHVLRGIPEGDIDNLEAY